MRHPSRLLAGLTDSGSAAAGTFLAGILAVRLLDTQQLALYALLFAASVLAMVLPRQLHYVPAQLQANLQRTPVSARIAVDARRAVPADVLTAVIVLVSGLPQLPSTGAATYLMLALTAASFSVLSPLQDHIRSCLHLVQRHWSAAACSVASTAAVAGVAGAGLAMPQGWSGVSLLPFGALLLANALSVALGAVLLAAMPRLEGAGLAPFKERSRFLLSEVGVQLAWFGCNSAILLLISARALGDLEAARVVASPLNIVNTGLLTFLGPALMRTVVAGDEHRTRRALSAVIATVLGAGVAYFLLLLTLGGVVSVVLDRPFDLALVGARLVSVVIEGSSGIVLYLLFGAARSRAALWFSMLAGAVGLLGTVALVPVAGRFALPVGQSVGMLVRLLGGMRSLSEAIGAVPVDRAPHP